MKEAEPERQKTLNTTRPSEAQGRGKEGVQNFIAKQATESPMFSEQLMEEIISNENVVTALKRVESNGGAAGVDEMRADKLRAYLRHRWPELKAQLLNGTYRPAPVRRVEIPKESGGVRNLGIPTALDRFIQQSILQVVQVKWDPTFCDQSYGFRPGRSQHQAIKRAQEHIAAGYEWVVDLDLEKFFDRVNHDRLMGRLAKSIPDKRVLKLIRAYLTSGVLENGLVTSTAQGTPQGGPLSPFLSNVVLDELDRELTKRGHRYVRYADDCNIYVKTPRAGARVMEGVTKFIEKRLKLKVNESKSAVAKPRHRKFLGFSFKFVNRTLKRTISVAALKKFKEVIRVITRRSRGRSLSQVLEELTVYLRGWIGYFGVCQTPDTLSVLDGWVRRRLRSLIWHQWKTPHRRASQLRKLGLKDSLARSVGHSSLGSWHISLSRPLNAAMSNRYFTDQLKVPQLKLLMKNL